MLYTKSELELLANIYELNVLEKQDITYWGVVNHMLALNSKNADENNKQITKISKKVNNDLENLTNKGVLIRQRIDDNGKMSYIYNFANWNGQDLAKALYQERLIPKVANSLSLETCEFLLKYGKVNKNELIDFNELDVYQLSRLQKIIKELKKNDLVKQDFKEKFTLNGKVLKLNTRGASIIEYLQEMKLEKDNDFQPNV